MSPAALQMSLFFGGFVMMFAIESLCSKRDWKSNRGRRVLVHVTLAALNTVMLRMFLVVAPLIVIATAIRDAGWGLAQLLGLSGLWEILVSLLVLDCLDYWWHRWNHRVPLFWRFHRVHHLDTHCDTSTALRFHIGELLISAFIKAGWIIAWGPSALAFVIFEISVSLASQFHHSNIDFPDGLEKVLTRFIVSPRFHASHHTVKRRTGDNNFSTILIFWDRLFGTYREPDREEMKDLGLPGSDDSYLSLQSTMKAPFKGGSKCLLSTEIDS